VTDAWERLRRPARLLYAAVTDEHLDRFGRGYEQVGVYMTDERPTGVAPDDLAVHLRLDGPLLDRKVTALRTMATQTGDLVCAVGLPAYTAQVAEEAFVAADDEPQWAGATGRSAAGRAG
jgi:hypothetical protein